MLQAATDKFVSRFNRVEDELRARDKKLGDVGLEELDEIWNAMKLQARQTDAELASAHSGPRQRSPFRAAQSPVYKWLDLAILPVPMAILINILLGFYVFVALLMVLVILMQRPKSEGLGAAFGGGVTENIFGAQTTNVLTKITGWLAAIFFLLTFALSILYAHKGNTQSGLRRELMKDLPPAVALRLAHAWRESRGHPSCIAHAGCIADG